MKASSQGWRLLRPEDPAPPAPVDQPAGSILKRMVDADGVEAYQPFGPFSKWADQRVGGAWSEYLLAWEEARDAAEPAALQAAVTFALRSAALQTGAIEGLYPASRGVTRVVALQAAMWEAELEKIGNDVRGHFEAQLAALDLVLDAATKNAPISEAWLRELHAQACAAQKTYRVLTAVGWQDHPLARGQYKEQPNNVGLRDGSTHWYAPVLDTPHEMHRLMEELRSELFLTVHPVVQAAYAHHALTAIHPFADGNGRVARALASVFTYRAAGIPIVIFSDQQERYWDALAAADLGRPESFVAFVDERAIDSMALVTGRLREAEQPLDTQVATIRDRFRAHGGLTHAAVQAVGERVVQQVQQAFQQDVSRLALQPDVQASFSGSPVGDCTFWNQPYHLLRNSMKFVLTLETGEPFKASVAITVIVGLANDVADAYAFIAIDASRSTVPPLKLRIGDVDPLMTASAEALIEGWVYQEISAGLDELRSSIDQQLKNSGFAAT